MNEGQPFQILQSIRFGEFLYERSLLDDEQLLDSLGDHWAHGGRIGETIVRRGFLTRAQIDDQLAAYHGLDILEIG